jgi:A/G-specific adenine glycosylase
MLQQTTVATVGPYFLNFIELWPTVESLARASIDDVLKAWAGLGYYARARNLHKCAQLVAGELNGRFPDAEIDLLALPGIGPYTAAAIAAIAFDRPATVVDGNVERVIARLYAVATPLPEAKGPLRDLAAGLTPRRRPGDYAQAMMDLGATICRPRNPQCGVCPLSAHCAALSSGLSAELPKRAKKPAKPVRCGTVYWVRYRDQVWLRRRPEKGLLGGLWEVPSSEWRQAGAGDSDHEMNQAVPIQGRWRSLPGVVKHTFTHFHLELKVEQLDLDRRRDIDGDWTRLEDIGKVALPTVMRKVIAHAIDAEAAA